MISCRGVTIGTTCRVSMSADFRIVDREQQQHMGAVEFANCVELAINYEKNRQLRHGVNVTNGD